MHFSPTLLELEADLQRSELERRLANCSAQPSAASNAGGWRSRRDGAMMRAQWTRRRPRA